MSSAPNRQIIQKFTDTLFRVFVKLVFNMKHEITHVRSDDDSISFQLAQVLSQHLLRGTRDEPRELTQLYRARSQRNLHLDWKSTLTASLALRISAAFMPLVSDLPDLVIAFVGLIRPTLSP